MLTQDLQNYKPLLIKVYTDKGLSKADAERRADYTLQAAAYIGLKLDTEQAPNTDRTKRN